MRPNWLPWAVGIGPPLLLHVCHGISAAAGLMPFCLPYLQGCVSVSAAARLPPANYLFDAVMIPAGVALAGFWVQAARTQAPGLRRYALTVLGLAAGLLMVLYATFLGAEESYARALRRIGINGYFLFNGLCQLLFALALMRGRRPVLGRRLLALWLAALGMGVLSVLEDVMGLHSNRIDNVIEWNFGLFMSLYFVVFAASPSNRPSGRED